MNLRPLSLEELQDRLLKLEKQNRRFKKLGIAALIVPVLMLFMGQAPSEKSIEANEFILRDSGGHIRARLAVAKDSGTKDPVAQLLLLDPDGSEKVHVDSGAIGRATKVVVSGASMTLSDKAEYTLLVPDTLLMVTADEKTSGMELGRSGLRVTDSRGFSASLGATELVKQRT